MSFSSDRPSLQNQLPLSIELPSDLDGMRTEINDVYQTIASAVNNKIGGLYVPEEKINSQQYFDSSNVQKFRNVYRMVVDFGALPNSSTKGVPHKITGWSSDYILTQSYGASTDSSAVESIPIPNDGIMLKINSADVTVTTTTDMSAFTQTTIVIEYTKN